MAKVKTRYVCSACGGVESQMFGRCPSCGQWGTLVEEVLAPEPSATGRAAVAATTRSRKGSRPQEPASPIAARTLAEIRDRPRSRWASGFRELDRVLGGGIVPGSLVLIGGDPGIGKSTLLLQTANQLARSRRVLYVCAEESGQQVKLRAQRLGVQAPAAELISGQLPEESPDDRADLYLLPETDLEPIMAEI
jgi:DNA repair protein RadA/Sms